MKLVICLSSSSQVLFTVLKNSLNYCQKISDVFQTNKMFQTIKMLYLTSKTVTKSLLFNLFSC